MSAFIGEGATGTADDRPLTDQEYRLLQRLLSDPFSLPIQFKTWLVSYLEASDMNLPISAINGLTQILGIAGVGSGVLGVLPAGLVFPFGGSTAPTGSLICDGAAYLRSTYDRLFKVIDVTFGAPDATSFNVPDLRARIPVGLGVTTDHDAVGKSDALPVGSRWVKHGHGYDFVFNWTPETPMGMHNFDAAAGTDSNQIPVGAAMEAYVGETAAHTHGSSASASLSRVGVHGQAEGPAYLTLNFIIVA